MANVGRMSSLFQSIRHLQWQLFQPAMLPVVISPIDAATWEDHQVYKQVYWMFGQFSKSIQVRCPYLLKIQDIKKLIHTTNDIPLPHHPSTLGQVIHPTLALSSPTWDPGERPYDHGSSWPHPLPSKHKDDEIWDEFQDISLSHLDSCWCAVECSPNVQVSMSQPTLAW